MVSYCRCAALDLTDADAGSCRQLAARLADRDALELLAERMIRVAQTVAQQRFNSQGLDWDELAQESVARLYEKLASWRGDSRLCYFLVVILTRLMLNAVRSQKRRDKALSAVGQAPVQPAEPLDPDVVDALRAAVDGLAEEDRALVLMTRDGMPAQEIADRLGIARRTYYFRWNRIRGKLMEALRPLQEEQRHG